MKESKCYTPTGFGAYAEQLGTLRASGGDVGGGAEMLILSYTPIPLEQSVREISKESDRSMLTKGNW